MVRTKQAGEAKQDFLSTNPNSSKLDVGNFDTYDLVRKFIFEHSMENVFNYKIEYIKDEKQIFEF
jgi:hypothetical protein